MLQFKKIVMAVALVAGMGSWGAAQAVTVKILPPATINTLFAGGGTFSMVGTAFGTSYVDPGDTITGSSHNIVGAYNPPGWDVNTTQTATAPSAIASFNFNNTGTFVNTFTAAASSQTGVTGGGSVPSGTVGFSGPIANGDTITVNLSSFFANGKGVDFGQGSSAATGTISNVAGNNFDYVLDWTSPIISGPYGTVGMGTWHLTGTGSVSAVPLPAAFWLLGSGLIGMAGLARRRKSGNVDGHMAA